MADVKYTPNGAGIRRLGASRDVQAAALLAANRIAADARQIAPKTEYKVSAATVTAGWHNEPRAGAMVTDTMTSSQGARRQSLKRAIAARKK